MELISIGLKPDESKLVKDFILLPLLLDVMEKDQGILSAAALKMPVITNTIIKRLQKAALADLSQVRQDMRRRGMKVYEERKTRLGRGG